MTYLEILNLIDTNLASGTNIMAVEHREVETAILNYSRYIGYMTGVNLPVADGLALTVSGDIASAVGSLGNGVLVTLTTAMPNTNYYIKSYVESLSTYAADTEIRRESFKKISTTQFYYIQSETESQTQNLKIHFEIVSLD